MRTDPLIFAGVLPSFPAREFFIAHVALPIESGARFDDQARRKYIPEDFPVFAYFHSIGGVDNSTEFSVDRYFSNSNVRIDYASGADFKSCFRSHFAFDGPFHSQPVREGNLSGQFSPFAQMADDLICCFPFPELHV